MMVAAKSQQPQFLAASLPLLINGYLQQTDCGAMQTKAERDHFPLGKESLAVLKASACSEGMMTQQCPVYQIHGPARSALDCLFG